MIPNTFTVGMEFTHPSAVGVTKVTEVSGNYVTFTLPNGKTLKSTVSFLRDTLVMSEWAYKEKPLDKAMKQLDKQFCLHKNVKRDTWFTARIFEHCADCGKALN